MNFFVKLFFLFISIAIPFSNYPEKISDYNIFIGDPHNLKTTTEFTPYDLITPLFTDYALKHRTIFIPKDKKINYHKIEAFDFPIGSIITKTFYYPYNFNDLSKGISLKETRILIHETDGWVGLPYIWNEDETEAFLEITGGIKKTRWIDSNGRERSINYIIPNMNQCKGCHAQDGITLPIGPKARHINHNYNYGDEIINQLTKWKELGYFEVLPNIEEISKIEKWNDSSTGSIEKRARAWLDINCAHCHNIKGSANNTGLFLDYFQTDKKALGILKTPVAAGRGSGDLKYDIFPGNSKESIMIYRFNSTNPAIMMPELGRTMVHSEGLELIETWINQMSID